MELKDKGVFLTGGARGIGRGMTEALLAKGARVLFVDILETAGKETEEALQKIYGADNVIFKHCDVTDADQLKAAFDAAVSKFEAVEICVNNAGVLDERRWEQMVAVNLMAPTHGSLLALEHMRRDKGGRGGVIINTASTAGLYSSYHCPVYTATKHAVVGFTKSWAANPRQPEYGVRWCCLCPTAVNTDLWLMIENQMYDADSCKRFIANRAIEVDDVVEAFMKLLHDQDSNGALLEIRKESQVYRVRQLVKKDGESNPLLADRV